MSARPQVRRSREDERGPARVLRGVSGVFAGGLVGLFLVLVIAWVLTTRTGSPGPGTPMLVGHGVAAGVAVAGQLVADRRADRTGTLSAVAVVIVGLAVPAFFWLL